MKGTQICDAEARTHHCYYQTQLLSTTVITTVLVGCEIRIHQVYEYKFSITYAAKAAKAIKYCFNTTIYRYPNWIGSHTENRLPTAEVTIITNLGS